MAFIIFIILYHDARFFIIINYLLLLSAIFFFSQLSAALSASLSRSILEPEVSSSGNPLELSSWGLPPEVLRKYNEMGITHMFEWQAACLQTGKVLTGGELGRFYFYKWKLIEGEAVPKEKVPLFYTFYLKMVPLSHT